MDGGGSCDCSSDAALNKTPMDGGGSCDCSSDAALNKTCSSQVRRLMICYYWKNNKCAF